MDITLKEAAKKLGGAGKILILTHSRPDADTIGSAFGLAHALTCDGIRKVKIACADAIPKRLGFLSEEKDLRLERYKDFEPDIVCALDAAETQLIKELPEDREIDIKIDHHPSGSGYARYNHIDGSAAATGELIFEVIEYLEKAELGRLTNEAATALYAAIASDTGCFKYTNVTPKTLRTAAALLEAGADQPTVSLRLFGTRTEKEILAEKLMLEGMKGYEGGRVRYLMLTNAVKEENGLCDEDLGEIVSAMREIEGTEVSVFVRQESNEPRRYKISMRSSESVNVSDICAVFGGGGHARAAGASIEAESADAAEETIMKSVLSAVKDR